MALQVNTKVCRKCLLSKPRSRFSQYGISQSGKPCYRKTCMDCRNKNNRKTRADSLSNERLKAKKRAFKEYLVALRGGQCERCKGEFPAFCYDFHHLNENTKLYTISNLMAYSISEDIKEKIFIEIEKCIMVCSNCHRIIHMETQMDKAKEVLNGITE